MKPETSWNALSVASLLACLGALAFYLYFPVASSKPILGARRISDAALGHARQNSDLAQELIDKKEWTLDEKALSGAVLAQLSAAAEHRKVQVTDLRFDKPIMVAGLKETPFTVMVDGDFDHVMDLVASLEGPGSKLGLSMLQIASSDQGPGFIKATIRLTAFLKGGF